VKKSLHIKNVLLTLKEVEPPDKLCSRLERHKWEGGKKLNEQKEKIVKNRKRRNKILHPYVHSF
jgi:hypothetical protein